MGAAGAQPRQHTSQVVPPAFAIFHAAGFLDGLDDASATAKSMMPPRILAHLAGILHHYRQSREHQRAAHALIIIAFAQPDERELAEASAMPLHACFMSAFIAVAVIGIFTTDVCLEMPPIAGRCRLCLRLMRRIEYLGNKFQRCRDVRHDTAAEGRNNAAGHGSKKCGRPQCFVEMATHGSTHISACE